MSVRNLTQKAVDAERWNGKTRFVRDKQVRGLILAVNKTSKTWKVQRDLWRGRTVKTVRHTLGSTDDLTLKQARERAQEVTAQIKRGVDPNEPEPAAALPGVATMTIGELWDAYEAWMREQDRAASTIEGFRRHLDKYLVDWRDDPLAGLRKSTCRERHARLTRDHGKYPANQAMRSLRAAYNFAIKLDDEDELRANPVGGVHFHPERRREAIILPEDLPDWWRRSEELPNSLRTTMHRLGLLSGLRPGTLVSLQREWIDLGGRAIRIPRMKSGRAFDLPLSEPMVALVENALRIGDVLYRDPPWLFPTRANDGRGIIHTQVWKEKTMRGETGHVLRHTYRTMADRLGIPQSRARALLDHKQPGIEAHYLHSSALRDELLADQERMTAHILETAKAL